MVVERPSALRLLHWDVDEVNAKKGAMCHALCASLRERSSIVFLFIFFELGVVEDFFAFCTRCPTTDSLVIALDLDWAPSSHQAIRFIYDAFANYNECLFSRSSVCSPHSTLVLRIIFPLRENNTFTQNTFID